MTRDVESLRAQSNIEKLAYIINSVDGHKPSPKSKRIIHFYINGDIDFETAKNILIKYHQK